MAKGRGQARVLRKGVTLETDDSGCHIDHELEVTNLEEVNAFG